MVILSNFDFLKKIDLLGKIFSSFSKPTGFLTLAPSGGTTGIQIYFSHLANAPGLHWKR